MNKKAEISPTCEDSGQLLENRSQYVIATAGFYIRLDEDLDANSYESKLSSELAKISNIDDFHFSSSYEKNRDDDLDVPFSEGGPTINVPYNFKYTFNLQIPFEDDKSGDLRTEGDEQNELFSITVMCIAGCPVATIFPVYTRVEFDSTSQMADHVITFLEFAIKDACDGLSLEKKKYSTNVINFKLLPKSKTSSRLANNESISSPNEAISSDVVILEVLDNERHMSSQISEFIDNIVFEAWAVHAVVAGDARTGFLWVTLNEKLQHFNALESQAWYRQALSFPFLRKRNLQKLFRAVARIEIWKVLLTNNTDAIRTAIFNPNNQHFAIDAFEEYYQRAKEGCSTASVLNALQIEKDFYQAASSNWTSIVSALLGAIVALLLT